MMKRITSTLCHLKVPSINCLTFPIPRHDLISQMRVSTVTNSSCEKLLHEVQVNPLRLYKKFYDNQYRILDNTDVLEKIVLDIDERLVPDSILHLSEFSNNRDKFRKLADRGRSLLQRKNIDPREYYTFVINYVKCMHELLEPNAEDGYHTKFTLSGMKSLYKIGDNR